MDLVAATQWLDEQATAMLDLTIDWAELNSGSYNLQGVNAVHDKIHTAFSELNAQYKQVRVPAVADDGSKQDDTKILQHYWLREDAPCQVLLVGHVDTVFPKDTAFNKTSIAPEDANILRGPGVTDMKGGIVVMLYALLAMEKLEIKDKLGWGVILTPDEEIGSKSSIPYLTEQAKKCQVGLVFEPALNETGTFAQNRYGSGKFKFEIKGLAAHAGRALRAGRNAIVAAAKLAIALDELNEKQDIFTINIGRITGGDALNVVPDFCSFAIDIRVADEVAVTKATEAMEQFVARIESECEVKIKMIGTFARPPKPLSSNTKQLFKILTTVATDLGQKVVLADTRGCCDGNNLQAAGLATIDTLGVIGKNIHSDSEYMLISSLQERAKLSLHLLNYLAEYGFGV